MREPRLPHAQAVAHIQARPYVALCGRQMSSAGNAAPDHVDRCVTCADLWEITATKPAVRSERLCELISS
jgi:hypothetical protein